VIGDVRILKDLYLSIFAVFFRTGPGLWPRRFSPADHQGILAVLFVQTIVVGLIYAWMGVLFEQRLALNRWVFWPLSICGYALNYYILVRKGVGLKFVRRFDEFPRSKRIALRFWVAAVFAVLLALVFVTADIYHRAVGIAPR
jgi:hypothetical protein